MPDKKPKLIEAPSILDMLITGKQVTQDGKEIQTTDNKPLKTTIETQVERKIAEITLQVIDEETHKLSCSQSLNELEIQQEIVQKVQHRIQPVQVELPELEQNNKTVAEIVKTVSENIIALTIDIPQIVILPTREVNYGFADFDFQYLETINYQPVSQEILLQHLEGDQKRDSIHFGGEKAQEACLEDYIVRNLMDLNEIDYDSHAEMLYKLAGQLVNHLKRKWSDKEKVENILIYYQRQIRDFIWAQMQDHQWSSPTGYQAKIIQGFDVLKPNMYSLAASETPRDFRAPVLNKQAVKKMLFTGFKRCCYPYQKFDSVDGELTLAQVLENDSSVLKWMKPAFGKFKIEYQNGESYEPDFVVETTEICPLIEPKRADQIGDPIVQAKKCAAVQWCIYANEHAEKIKGKKWVYLLIPHNEILPNSSLKGLIERFG